MVDIETINTEYQHAGPVGQFRNSAGKFGCDLLELAELQGKLFSADAKSAMQRSMAGVMLVLFGCLSLLGCMPVLILGIASAIAYYFEIETWISLLAVGCSLSIISMIIIAVALTRLKNSGMQFKRSSEEFSKNIEWAKDIFSGVPSRKN